MSVASVLQGREIVVGVAGGIAAYKSAMLVSSLVQQGAGVTVVMTPAAHQFIGAATFRALTGRAVPEDMFEPQGHPLGAHIDLAERAEILCIAPCTANVLAKAAGGVADDLLSTLILAMDAPILLAPAMNNQMWEKAAVQRNVVTLRNDGFQFVGPEAGWLSCRKRGVGRMADPQTILAAIERMLSAGRGELV